jgi:hypothetical protein
VETSRQRIQKKKKKKKKGVEDRSHLAFFFTTQVA